MKRIGIIGSGFAGLSAAATLAKQGHEVHVFEKNDQVGGRATTWEKDGFMFDLGPSWYWMPEVFEQFYSKFGHTTSDFYELKRLDPSYRVFCENSEQVDLPASVPELFQLFETIQPGSSAGLQEFLHQAEIKYRVAMEKFVWMPGTNWTELLKWEIVKYVPQLNMFGSVSDYVSKFVTDKRLQQILEFPVLFLGAKPSETPALYTMMNHADLVLGTWYPMGGMVQIPRAFEKICRKQGVQFHLQSPVEKIEVSRGKATGIIANATFHPFDIVISGADYHHTETNLLKPEFQQYSANYWNTRKMAPSSLLYYVGLNKKLDHLKHHNLFFDTDFEPHANSIYKTNSWPQNPLFYLSVPSITDPSIAPEGKENIFILIPTAPGLEQTPEIEEKYFNLVLDRIEKATGQEIRSSILFKRNFGCTDFISRYNSYKGNAYGLANTLLQTANLKPRIKSNKVKDLWYCGQLTVPGPGVPPAIISGQIVASEIAKSSV
ncbi:MAG: phytoene desaturase [Bacteroidia bacterium]|nr:phytoene desaturase [Bacteroidia bacterium]